MRRLLLTLAAVRAVLAIVAIPLAPVLVHDHLALLVLLRPSKEVLLLAGYAIEQGNVNPGVVVAAALPLLVGAVWIFYFLGQAYADDLDDADLPGVAGRLLPRKRITSLRDAVAERGWPLVFLGRLAAAPSTLVAASAGASEVDGRTFAIADLAGALTSLVAMLVAGSVLGEAYERAGPWFTIAGGVAVLGLLTLLGKQLTDGGHARRAPAHAS